MPMVFRLLHERVGHDHARVASLAGGERERQEHAADHHDGDEEDTPVLKALRSVLPGLAKMDWTPGTGACGAADAFC